MSERACAVDLYYGAGQYGCWNFTCMAPGSGALCDDQVDTGGGVPQQSSALFAPSSSGAPFRSRNG